MVALLEFHTIYSCSIGDLDLLILYIKAHSVSQVAALITSMVIALK